MFPIKSSSIWSVCSDVCRHTDGVRGVKVVPGVPGVPLVPHGPPAARPGAGGGDGQGWQLSGQVWGSSSGGTW